MELPIIILIVSFLILLIMNVPIAVCIGLASFWAIQSSGPVSAVNVLGPRLASGINSFALLAIPFFILMGQFMGKGGIAKRLIDFAEAAVGRFPGGLAFVNILTCMFFGAISGSAVAAVSSIGGVMMPEMERKGYDKNFNIALSSCSATVGMVIPPSNIMIVYATVTGTVSVAALFLAGIIPGIIIGLSLMVVAGIISYKEGYGAAKKIGFKETVARLLKALPGLFLIVIVIGGVLSGYFTPTEAASIAVVYSFILAVLIYQEVDFSDIPDILLKTGETTAVVMLLIGASTGMSWFMATQNIPELVSSFITSISSNRIVILMMINVILLFVGTFLDMSPAVLIFTPIFLPIVHELGLSLVHFGIIIIANLCIGLVTPPVGTVLFVGVKVGDGKISEVFSSLLIMFVAMIFSLILITYIPKISMFLPNLLGF